MSNVEWNKCRAQQTKRAGETCVQPSGCVEMEGAALAWEFQMETGALGSSGEKCERAIRETDGDNDRIMAVGKGRQK